MEKMYDVTFCRCGRIHVFPMGEYDWLAALQNKRAVVQVCKNCGRTTEITVDPFYDGFVCNKNTEGAIRGDRECHVYADEGFRVPIKSSANAYATGYHERQWIYEDAHVEVDTKKLIEEVNNLPILHSIRGYVSGIDWSGTEMHW